MILAAELALSAITTRAMSRLVIYQPLMREIGRE
jgi:hypothetical protein